MEIKLSILIATMPSRQAQFNCLMGNLYTQTEYLPEVEILSDASMEYNIGVKRNKLLSLAKGQYVVFCDDDDRVSGNYVSAILKAIETKPDCVGISGHITFNGYNRKQWHISKEYKGWFERKEIYYRTSNHISPVRRELALQAGFPEIAFGEDYEYSMRLLPFLKTEVIIPENLYFYDYIENK
jgi:glycosyltransferase involved in cell wall biosynthesis